MIAAIASLLFCQLAGEVLARGLMLPLPGPVVGMALLFVLLLVQGRRRSVAAEPSIPVELGRVADALLQNLSLLFIPAATGIVQYLGLLRTYAVPIALAIVVSTIAALVVTALTFHTVARLVTPRLGDSPGAEPQ